MYALYCHLIAPQDTRMQRGYHQAIKQELQKLCGLNQDLSLSVVYIKMSTACYPDHLLLDIAGTLRDICNLKNCNELTVELVDCMPVREDLACWKRAGINRVNLRTTFSHDLEVLTHYVEQFVPFFSNIAIDLFLESVRDKVYWGEVVTRLVSLPLAHVALEFAKGLGTRAVEFFELCKTKLDCAGFEQYELFHFARGKLRSHYMQHLWDQKPIIGSGIAAHTSIGMLHYENESDATEYVNAFACRASAVRYVERLSNIQYAVQEILLNLRRKKGFGINTILHLLPEQSKDSFVHNIRILNATGLLSCTHGRCVLTSKGQWYERVIVEKLINNI